VVLANAKLTRVPYFMTELIERKCKPCEGGVDPLTADQVAQLMPALHADWGLSESGTSISREFRFPGFARTIAFVNAVAWIAINEGHHPEMAVRYGSCVVTYMTTAISGLSDNDFICAAKIDRLAAE
jgi:4a-hydroxytetrahydrobiopterin dehydratase